MIRINVKYKMKEIAIVESNQRVSITVLNLKRNLTFENNASPSLYSQQQKSW